MGGTVEQLIREEQNIKYITKKKRGVILDLSENTKIRSNLQKNPTMLVKAFFFNVCFMTVWLITKGQEDIAIKHVRATNATEIKDYGEVAENFDCVPFDPQMTDPVNVSKLDPTKLVELLTAYSKGNLIEMCTEKEKNRSMRRKQKRNPLIILAIVLALR